MSNQIQLLQQDFHTVSAHTAITDTLSYKKGQVDLFNRLWDASIKRADLTTTITPFDMTISLLHELNMIRKELQEGGEIRNEN